MKKREIKEVDGVFFYRCSTCEKFFTSDSFYKTKRPPFYLTYECRKCHQITAIATRSVDKHRDSNRAWMRSSKYNQRPEVMSRHMDLLRTKNNTIETRARALANKAVQLGFLVKPSSCCECGRSGLKIHAHHDDYSNPLLVRWLCIECHGKTRRK